MAYSKARRLSDSISATGEVSAFVDGSITHADLHTDMDLTGKTVLVANASTGDSDTTAANTAFVQQEIAALVASAPGTLNTLNELAAALGDDASFSTTVTDSIALKAPLASPTFTGTLEIPNLTISSAQGTDGQVLTSTGSGIAWENVAAGYTDSDVETYLNTSEIYTDATNNRLGIGTASPTTYLDVRAPSGVTAPTVAYFKSDQHGLGVYVNIGSTFSEIRSNNNSYPLVLNASSGGNVGIGTAAPVTKLHIEGSSTSTYTGAGPSDTLRVSGSTVGNWISSDFDGAMAYFGTDSGTSAKFAAYDYATSTEMDMILGQSRVYIKNDGKIGIGVGDPDAKLEIKGEGGGSDLTLKTTDASSNETFFVNGGGRTGVRYYPLTIGKASSVAAASESALDMSSTTGGLVLSLGTTAQRPSTPSSAGYTRYNSSIEQIEHYSGTGWGSIGGRSQGEQLARQYCTRTGGTIVYVSTGSGTLNSALDAMSHGDALVLSAGSYTVTRKSSQIASSQNDNCHPFREKEVGIFGDTNNPADVTLSVNIDDGGDVRDHPIFNAVYPGAFANAVTFLGFLKFVRNPSTVFGTNYSNAIARGNSGYGVMGGAQNVLFDFNGTDVSWFYDNNNAESYLKFKNCTFDNYASWVTNYTGNMRNSFTWGCIFNKASETTNYVESGITAGNKIEQLKGNKHGVTLSSGTYNIDTYGGAGHLHYDQHPVIFWNDRDWPGSF